MQVLLLGGARGLGLAIRQQLILEGHDVTTPNINQWDHDFRYVRNWTAEHTRPLEDGTPVHHHNIAVINTTEVGDIDQCQKLSEVSLTLNALLPSVIAEGCRESNVRFFHFSSDQAFGQASWDGRYRFDPRDDPRHRITERQRRYGEINTYGLHKAIGEELALAYERTTICRVQWLYGGGEGWIDQMAKSLKEREPVTAISDWHGVPTHVGDVARAMAELLNVREPKLRYHLISSSEPTSHLEVVSMLASALGCGCITPRTRAQMVQEKVWTINRADSPLKQLGQPELPHWKQRFIDHFAPKPTVAV